MYKVILLVCASLLLVSLAPATMAQDDEGLKDKFELQAAAAWASVADIDVTALAFNAGKFLTRELEAQLGFLYLRGDLGGGSASLWAIAPAAVYNFVPKTPSSVVPYVGLGWYYLNGDSGSYETDENGLHFFVGAKFFLKGDYKTSNQAIFLEYRRLQDVFDQNIDLVWAGFTNFF